MSTILNHMIEFDETRPIKRIWVPYLKEWLKWTA
jgi:hypothetical protein